MSVTNEQYWLSQDPQVEAIRHLVLADGSGLPDIGARELLAQQLYAMPNKNFNPDRDIWIWGWDAGIVMYIRQHYYKVPWVPNAFQPQLTATTDMSNPWDRSIPTVTDAAAYPPFIVPAPPPPTVTDHVGALNGYIYNAVNVELPSGQWAYAEGQQITHVDAANPNGVVLCFHIGMNGIAGVVGMWLPVDKYNAWKQTGIL